MNVNDEILLTLARAAAPGAGGGGSRFWPEWFRFSDEAAVCQLEPGTYYTFCPALGDGVSALTVTLRAPDAQQGEKAHYRFSFVSGAVPTVLSLPSSVHMPDGFAVAADTRYEVDILNNYAAVTGWAVSGA